MVYVSLSWFELIEDIGYGRCGRGYGKTADAECRTGCALGVQGAALDPQPLPLPWLRRPESPVDQALTIGNSDHMGK